MHYCPVIAPPARVWNDIELCEFGKAVNRLICAATTGINEEKHPILQRIETQSVIAGVI